MTPETLARALARCDVFSGLAPDQLNRLARECRGRRFDAGEQVFARGDVGGGLYVLVEGSVALSVSSSSGGEVTLAVCKPPAAFGELAVIDGGARAATATARRATVAVAVPRASARWAMDEVPSVATALLMSMATVIRQVDQQATDLVLLGLRGRVARFLADVGDAQPRGEPGLAVPVDLGLTQTELARLVGGSRQRVNQVIAELEAAGAVERVRSRIVAVRPDLLRTVS